MEEAKIKSLLKKYAEGNSSPEENAFLEDWYIQWNKEQPLGLTSQELSSDLLLIKAHTPDFKEGPKRMDLWPKAMPAVLMLAAESSLLQAEYTDGVQKSYQYLYTGSATLTAAQAVLDANTYLASNIGNPLIDFVASPNKQETIIYHNSN